MNLLTSSRIRAAHACPRLDHYRYGLGLVAPSTGAMAFGTAIHAGLEAWWATIRDGLPGDALDAALAVLDCQPLADPYDLARAEAMLVAYDVRWLRWACSVEVLAIEAEFRAPLRHPDGRTARTWSLAGKLDALVRLSDGRVAIVEHKTTSRDAGAGTEYRARLTLDPQVSVYHDGAAALGYAADLCLYDVLVKPSQKPLTATPDEDRVYTQPKSRACKACRKAPGVHVEDGITCAEGRIVTDPGGRLRAGQRVADETPEEYRARLIEAIAADPDRYLIHAEIVRTERDRAEHGADVWETVHAIEHHRRRLPVLPPRHASACFAHGSPCAFLPLCEGRGRIEDYARGGAHAELTTMTTTHTENAA